MKRSVFLFLFLLLVVPVPGTAQTDTVKIANDIKEQVWKVFKTSYEARDAVTFNSIHTEDMLRINDGGILTGAEYKARTLSWTSPPAGTTITIDFALENTHYREDVAYEVGYYRAIYTLADGRKEYYCGQFHVVHKKTDQGWKIAQDFDTNSVNGIVIDETFFNNASLMKL